MQGQGYVLFVSSLVDVFESRISLMNHVNRLPTAMMMSLSNEIVFLNNEPIIYPFL